MKIYIGSCGIGLGHVTRCETIARELSRRGADVYFSSYSDGLDYLRHTRFRYFSAVPVSFRTREDGTIDLKRTMTQNGVTISLWRLLRQLVTELIEISRYGPSVVVSDTRISTLIAGFLLRKPTLLIINQYSVLLPDSQKPVRVFDRLVLFSAQIVWKYASAVLQLLWGLGSVIVVPDLKSPFTISRYNLTIPRRVMRKVRMIGPLSSAGKRVAFKGIPNGIHKTKQFRPLVFSCVSGPKSDGRYLVKILSQIMSELPDSWELVLCCGDPNGSSLPQRLGKLTLYEWMEDDLYLDHFNRAVVVISRAGHGTVMRAVSAGKPMVLIPPPNHTEQGNNAKRAQEMGIAVVLEQARLNSNELVKAVRESIEKSRVTSETLGALARREDGVEKIVEIVRELAVSPGI